MAKLFSIRPPMTLKGRHFKGLRGWSGKPLHPPLTDIPIAAYLLAAVFDLISYIAARGDASQESGAAHDFFVAATFVIIAGAVASLGAVVTGFWDWWKGVEREPSGFFGRAQHTQVWRTMNWHMTVMLTVTVLVIADIVVRLSGSVSHATLPPTILSVLAAALVSYGAIYGGALVYDYQFNVEGLEGSTVWDETDVDQMPSDHSQSGW
jgi:uncharacterized membrane protein